MDPATEPHPLDLAQLAGVVVARVRPNAADRAGRDDCFQQAYLAGLQAVRAAESKHERPSSHWVYLAMQSSTFRMIRQRGEVRESDLPN